MLFVVLRINKYVIYEDNHEFIQIRLAHSVHEVHKNRRYWILGVDQRDHRSLTGAPQGEELGLMKPFSESSCSCSNNSFISDGAKRYGARATGATPGTRSIWNSTGRAGVRPGKSLGTLQESLG
uniref:Ribose-phosphate pyrophosphokinase 4-like n=1 Tax=Tanacetum cinerariifolium TaxID=118510 RepID=A0A699S005_TANCI|nr:ribose-phosphate pyrophosphokinase 4-like [Tanacetum cinerariifolium]